MHAYLLGLYITLILVRPMDWWPPLAGFQLVTIAAIGTVFVGMPVILARMQLVWRRNLQLKAVMGLLVGAILSWFARFWVGGMINALADIGRLVVFFGLLLILTRNLGDAKVLLWSLLICLAWLGVHAILQHHQGYGFGGQMPLWRVRNRQTGEGVWQAIGFGTFEDPNDLCVVLIVAIPLYYVQSKIAPNPLQKVIALAGVGVCAYGAWCTNSRGGVIAIFGMVSAYVMIRMQGFKRYATAAFMITAVTIVAPSRFSGNLIARDRVILWGDGLAMFKANPFFGVGYAMFSSYSNGHLVCHNTYIHTLAELGLVGYLPLFLMIYLTMVQLRRTIRLKDELSRNDQLLLSGIFSALVGYLTGLYFISRQYQHIFYVILAVAITTTSAICVKHGLTDRVYGNLKKDLRQGFWWGLGSVVGMWIAIRVANALS